MRVQVGTAAEMANPPKPHEPVSPPKPVDQPTIPLSRLAAVPIFEVNC